MKTSRLNHPEACSPWDSLGRCVAFLAAIFMPCISAPGAQEADLVHDPAHAGSRITEFRNGTESSVIAVTWGRRPLTLVPRPEPSLVKTAAEQRTAGKVELADAKAAKGETLTHAKAKTAAARKRLADGGRFKAGEALVMGIPVRWIPPGRFTMGSLTSEEGRFSNETLHEVELSRGFFLAETECTQAQWEAVMGSNPADFKGSDRPVEHVNWYEAVEYCGKLTAKQRAEGELPEGWEWRLPTEAEWEYAARAGKTGPRHGNLDAIAWYQGNSGNQTHPVKQKAANAWGLYDMIGNVSEWCSDFLGAPPNVVADPAGLGTPYPRVYRGGCWLLDAKSARSAFRSGFFPVFRYNHLGFRPALSLVR